MEKDAGDGPFKKKLSLVNVQYMTHHRYCLVDSNQADFKVIT